MRVHVFLEDDLVRELDEIVGPRGRSPFIADAVREKVDQARRWRKIESAIGSISDTGHEWDEDPAAWVHEQRRKGERPLP
jgi:metal-responsive CopG/Arc/MetJ family transcriptional regulator